MGCAVSGKAAGVDPRVLDVIRRVVLEEAGGLGVRVERIVLFGSRARGEARGDSDYDILIIVKDPVEWSIRRRFYSRTHRRLVSLLGKPVDLLIVDSEWFRERSSMPTTFESEVSEGVEIPL